MYDKTLKSNDALRLEFIRSVIRNVSDDQDRGVVQAILLTFIKGSARTRLAASDESVLNAYIGDVIEAWRKPDADGEALIREIAALAKHVAETEAAPVATFLQSMCDDERAPVAANDRS